MDSPFKVLQERTNRLNLQYTTENFENIFQYNASSHAMSSGQIKPDSTNNDESLNLTSIVRELETQMDFNVRLQAETDLKISSLEEDTVILLDMNKKQVEEIAELRAQLVQAEGEREQLEEMRSERLVMLVQLMLMQIQMLLLVSPAFVASFKISDKFFLILFSSLFDTRTKGAIELCFKQKIISF